MDWPQAILVGSSGAGGVLAIYKLLQAIERKKSSRASALFLNGDKEEVIRQLQRLVQADRDRHKEHLEIQSKLEELETDYATGAATTQRLGVLVERISSRLDRAGIP
jgi:3-polyprenyl-4-hydroxybenzoate decarboxylase